MLHVTTPTDPHAPIVVTMTGEYDAGNAGTVMACLETFDGQRPVILDLTDTSFIDSQTIGVIAYTCQRGVDLSVRNACALVERVLDVSGVASMLSS